MRFLEHPAMHAWPGRLAGVFVVMVLCFLFGLSAAFAQDDTPDRVDGTVQVLSGRIEMEGGGTDFYRLPFLREGDTLYVYMRSRSGNLDPFLGLADTRYDGESLRDAFWADFDLVLQRGDDPLTALPAIYDEFFVAWNDDWGGGYNAALQFHVPETGAYQLLVTGTPTRDTFGDYQLILGVNAPQVLTGDSEATPGVLAVRDPNASASRVSVQEITGTLTITEPLTTLVIEDLKEGDLLYAYVEGAAGESAPALILEDFGEKPLRSDNLLGEQPSASLSYRPLHDVRNLRLVVALAFSNEMARLGDFRLLLGLNAPEVKSGDAQPKGLALVKEPWPVRIGVRLEQITGVDQVAERFGAVAELTMNWKDPNLAFSPDSCHCNFKVFTGNEFEDYAEAQGSQWPQFTLLNQQGNRWTQNKNVVLLPEGDVTYFERFTTDFQAPDFDFTRFPFDSQQLYIRVESLYPDQYVIYLDPEDLSDVGGQLGEEEWWVVDSSTETGIHDSYARYALGFLVHRQLNYYLFRIIVPILLIIIVSWFTFFLKDYAKRVDVASANLLVFVAFNFTVSGELPRLGYLTFLDAVLIGVFVISAVVVMVSVWLKRLEARGKRDTAEKIDGFLIWVYPLLYAAGGFAAYWIFLYEPVAAAL